VNDFLPFIVSGIATGAIYGLAGTGLVLTYKTSGIFNFAHGAVAASAAYFFYWLNVVHGIGWVWSLILSVVVLGTVLGWLLELMGRRLTNQPVAMKIVGTIGLILVVQGLATIKFGVSALRQPQYLPDATKIVRVGGVNISYAQITITAIAIVAVLALYLLFRYSRLGLAMRAVVDDPDLVRLHGISPTRTRRMSWIVGATFAALSGVLVAPSLGVESIALVYLVVQAFGAAAIGGFSNIPLTYAGGILIGIGSSLATKYVLNLTWLSGLPNSLPFVVLIVVLILLPRRKLTTTTRTLANPPVQWTAPPRARAAAAILSVGFLACVPLFAGDVLPYYLVGLTQAILLLSLGLLVRTAGLVSLSHAAFAAIGAVAFSQFMTNLHLPWLIAVLLGALVVVPVAAVLALPAIRLSGVFLALATFGFGLFVERMLYPRNFMFTPFTSGRAMPRPSFAQGDNAFYFVVLAFLVVIGAAMMAIHRARLGRLLSGMNQSPLAMGTAGLSLNVIRTIVFCISGYFAGIAGILYGATVHFASFGNSQYASFESLILVALLALSPFREPWYAVFAVIATVIPGYWSGTNTTYWLTVAFGVFAVMTALQGSPLPMPIALRRVIERVFASPTKASAPPPQRALVAVERPARTDGPGGLAVTNLVVRFGGNSALDGVSLEAPTGRITGLIGPNGAGKTTLFNVCSGLIRPSEGSVVLHGANVTRMGPGARATRGLGRTFQIVQLCESMTVAENVELGREAGQAGANPFGQVSSTPSQRRAAVQAARDAMEIVGIGHLRDQQAGSLSTGQRRLIELARCLTGDFDVLLLDEPSAGLDPVETAEFGKILKATVRERGCGILLVEHDMSLVLDVCSYIFVLDFGKQLFEGTPAEIAASPLVKAAYLGTHESTIVLTAAEA
jgi:ABC-type branched-subunit amino acid transport system ATPase component/branched-subunit amino acid ABC-type transport system permease component